VQCGCGQRHWGRYGAAGLLLADDDHHVVLQHRAPWSHQGGTWGIPGGARNRDETALQAAVREASEEAGVRGRVRPHASYKLAHPDWSYTTVLARTRTGMPVAATDHESVEVRWHPIEEVTELPLLGAFGRAWPVLRQMLQTRAVLVVDGANVVGSRPDGWWQDRAGATSKLAGRLARVTDYGVPADLLDLPGHRWWPHVVLVTEGKARAAEPAPNVHTVAAPGDGDEAIIDAVEHLVGGGDLTNLPASVSAAGAAVPGASTADRGVGVADSGVGVAGDGGHDGVTGHDAAAEFGVGQPETSPPVQHVVAVSADRELRRRVQDMGARVVGPRQLWQILDDLPA